MNYALLSSGPKGAFSSIHSFIEDNNGNFWLPTNNGLYKVPANALADFATTRKNPFSAFQFNIANGLRTNEFNSGANPEFPMVKGWCIDIAIYRWINKILSNKLAAELPRKEFL